LRHPAEGEIDRAVDLYLVDRERSYLAATDSRHAPTSATGIEDGEARVERAA